MGALTDFLLKGSRSKKVGPCMHRTSVRVNKTIQSWIPRPEKRVQDRVCLCGKVLLGSGNVSGGVMLPQSPALPSKTSHKYKRGRREGCEKRKRIGCAALFFDAAGKTAIWLRCVQCSVPSLRQIHHSRFVDPPRLAIHEQNVQACHAVMLTWEDSEKCRVVLRMPRLVRRSMLPCLRL